MSENQAKLDDLVRQARAIRSEYGDSVRDSIVTAIYAQAERLAASAVSPNSTESRGLDEILDNIVTSRVLGYPLMLALLGTVFWVTIAGANYPSEMLASALFALEEQISGIFVFLGAPEWLHGVLVLGTYRGLAWVVSVMLPPMAIFFPIFTILEDFGYLPRVAFNLDRFFKRVGAHGKQSLTMAMGFGCNAAGVIAARIIDSPRERLVAILTNNFVPCNGRFPLLISVAMIFMGASVATTYSSIAATALVVGVVVLGMGITLAVSWGLTKTILKGEPSSFTLELPPYRRPQIGRVIIRSFYDRTIFVLGRAVMVAAPAGAITWMLANTFVGDLSIAAHIAGWLEPFGRLVGLDGVILLAFILGLPANEIVIPIMLMLYLSAGSMLELDSLGAMRELLVDQGWNWVTALNFMLLTLLHFPCGTVLLTIRKETGSAKWTWLAALIPTIIGLFLCFLVAQGAKLIGLV